MSHDSDILVAFFNEIIKKFQSIGNAQTCAFLVRYCSGQLRDNDEVVFRIPGVFSSIIHAVAYASIKRLPLALDREFTAVFNELRSPSLGISSLAGNPTVRQILMCPEWFSDTRDFIMAPDKTTMVTADEFVKIAPNFTRNDTENTWSANPILLSLLIEAIEGDTLYTILKGVLQELGMKRTFIGSTELPSDYKTPSFHVSSKGIATPYELEDLTIDTIEIAISGGFTCIADLECFFNSLRTSERFEGFLDLTDGEHSPLGLYPRLDSKTPGSLSHNATLAKSGGKVRQMALDIPFVLQGQRVHYMAGYDRGWCCGIYFNEVIGLVIVLCDTTGPSRCV
jgi:hypothetical protein